MADTGTDIPPPMPAQGPQRRTEPILAALADMLLVVNDLGQVLDTVSGSGQSVFADVNGQLPWEQDPSITVGVALFGEGAKAAVQFDLNLGQLVDGFLPEDLVLAQLPSELHRSGRLFEIGVVPLRGRPQFEVLVRLVDVTEQADERARARGNNEFRMVMERLMDNIEASRGFFGETAWLLGQITEEDDNGKLARDLHTLKGNVACFGFDELATQIHRTEDILIAGDRPGTLTAIEDIRQSWSSNEETFGTMFASRADREIFVSREEYEEVVMLCMMQADYTQLLGEVQRWAMDPISRVFARLEVQVKRTASHLGKNVEVIVDHNNVRLPATGLEGLWSSLVHIVRNAIDHGIESPERRVEAGKSEAGRITMHASTDDDFVYIAFTDDGAGVDWDRVREKAVEHGLPHETEEELARAMLSEGVSTAATLSQNSGRGVGTSAVLQAVQSIGGDLAVESTRGEGSTFRVQIPLAGLATLGLLS